MSEKKDKSNDLQTRFNLARKIAQRTPSNGERYVTPKGALKWLPDPDMIDWNKVDAAMRKTKNEAGKDGTEG